MAVILHIETSTQSCSAGISSGKHLLAFREDHRSGYSHARLLTVYINEVLEEASLDASGVSAVAVSKGPGSYTGLRIGVSAAKGFCFARDIPLIAVDTLQALAARVLPDQPATSTSPLIADPRALLCPMIDARRMEVYCALFNQQLEMVSPTKALVVNEDSFTDVLSSSPVIFFGDGAAKCQPHISHPNATFLHNIWPSARGMVNLAHTQYEKGAFENLAYFEPFYLKDFVAGPSKVKGLYT